MVGLARRYVNTHALDQLRRLQTRLSAPEAKRQTAPRPWKAVTYRSESEIDAMVAAYEAGSSLRDLVAQFGLSRTRAKHHLHKRGVKLRPRGTHPRP